MALKFSVSLLISLLMLLSAEAGTYDVTKYGARPNGELSQALVNAWKEACADPSSSAVVIPRATYKSQEVKLSGPCRAHIELKVGGTIQANGDAKSFKTDGWFSFENIRGFTLSGGGTFDGQGARTWAETNCRENPLCPVLPYNLRFDYVTNGMIQYITSLNSKHFHANVLGCNNVTFQHFTATAPGDSPNTDGIHIGRSRQIYVLDSNIKTGDDCISIGDGSHQLHIERVTCGPGHGISVGSLGKYPNEESVSEIFVQHCTLTNTLNGVRIKSWPASPSSLTASDMHFEDVIVNNVGNPIIIDQEYCPWNRCRKGPSKVRISNVSFKNIRGTSSTAEVMRLVCSKDLPCLNVEIGDVDLKYSGLIGTANSTCNNVNPRFTGRVSIPGVCGSRA